MMCLFDLNSQCQLSLRATRHLYVTWYRCWSALVLCLYALYVLMGGGKYVGVQTVFTHHSLLRICLVNVVCLLLWLFSGFASHETFPAVPSKSWHVLAHTHTHTHTHTRTHYTCLCNERFNICGLKCWQRKSKNTTHTHTPPQTFSRMCTSESVFFAYFLFVSFSQFIRSIRNVPQFHACLAVPFHFHSHPSSFCCCSQLKASCVKCLLLLYCDCGVLCYN